MAYHADGKHVGHKLALGVDELGDDEVVLVARLGCLEGSAHLDHVLRACPAHDFPRVTACDVVAFLLHLERAAPCPGRHRWDVLLGLGLEGRLSSRSRVGLKDEHLLGVGH